MAEVETLWMARAKVAGPRWSPDSTPRGARDRGLAASDQRQRKGEASAHFGQNFGAIDTIEGVGNVDQKQLHIAGRWSTSHASGARCAQHLRTHQACASQRGLDRLHAFVSMEGNVAVATKHRAGDRTKGSLRFCEEGQEGGSAKPGSNLRRLSALEHDGNHFSQEAKEVIPAGWTERLTQMMEHAPGDERIKPRALRTESTLTR